MTSYDWNKISKSKIDRINKSKPIFILGPRGISPKRVSQLTKLLSSKANLLWGCLKDSYIPGLEGSEQFKSLQIKKLQESIPKKDSERISVLEYYQRDIKYILKEITPKAVIMINGSWHRSMHLREEFWVIQEKKIPYRYVSPFIDEEEAKKYESIVQYKYAESSFYSKRKKYTDTQIMEIVNKVAKRSFDHTYQTGATIAQNGKIIITSYNKILPYETYAMHHGSLKEQNFSPPNDLNNYDAMHAEVHALLQAQKQNIDLQGSTLYINLLPCPTCGKMIAACDIKEIVYKHDHSEGYTYKLLTEMGKVVRRVI